MKEYSDNVKRILISENEKASIKKLYEQAVVDTKKLESRYTDFVSTGQINDPNQIIALFADLNEDEKIELLRIFKENYKNFTNKIQQIYTMQYSIDEKYRPLLINLYKTYYNTFLKTKTPAAQPAVNTNPTNTVDDFKTEMNKKSTENFKKIAGQELASKDRLIVRDPDLKVLQQKLGVNPDGVLGPQTWGKIKEKGLIDAMIRALDLQQASDQGIKNEPTTSKSAPQIKTTSGQGFKQVPETLK